MVIGAVAVTAGWADERERRIPNRVVLVGAVAALAIAVASGAGWAAVAGASTGGGPLLALHLARPAGVGFGDVKLAMVLGALLGMVHWPLAAVALAVATVLGLAGAVVVRSWRRSVPFGACLGAAALVTLALAPAVGRMLALW